ncbi:alginate export family protein [Aliiglaciecola sp. M165]|uniref:alginate export family protein n=1 Tax=Aliiglaciecola sp. M165 TaxID=2593649 RepID=UPI001180BFA5|nr:alginate export family protein [Aliiglaciecola sp. M165]TRY30208.1 hypothetical protein FM019_15415 [Aliiglaciecola sp. M165]
METKTHKKHAIALAFAISTVQYTGLAQANDITEALTSGTTKLDMRLRLESVDQDNALEDASALTLRTRLGYTTGSINGFSATIELEDNRIVLGEGDYTVGPTGFNPGQYSVIADPEFTELDQGFIQYKNDSVLVKLGRQVLTFDNHRFVGHVGWRQDRQTFDGVSAKFTPSKNASVTYAYLNQRNRIFGESADLDSKDHVINGSYKTSVGTLTGYGYFLEVDNDTENNLDTFGVRFNGVKSLDNLKVLYTAEFASQSFETAEADFDADYLFVEAGIQVSGITAKLGYESLGSDDGQFGFATPLATLHKFNGWADQFLATPAQGLVDTSFALSGSLGGGKWLAVYHDFEADDATAEIDDLGSEINLQYTKKFAKHYNAGIKFASYSGESGRVDADKLWVWVGGSF